MLHADVWRFLHDSLYIFYESYLLCRSVDREVDAISHGCPDTYTFNTASFRPDGAMLSLSVEPVFVCFQFSSTMHHVLHRIFEILCDHS